MNHISKINLSNEGWDATTENLIVSGVYEEKNFSSQAQLINISSENNSFFCGKFIDIDCKILEW